MSTPATGNPATATGPRHANRGTGRRGWRHWPSPPRPWSALPAAGCHRRRRPPATGPRPSRRPPRPCCHRDRRRDGWAPSTAGSTADVQGKLSTKNETLSTGTPAQAGLLASYADKIPADAASGTCRRHRRRRALLPRRGRPGRPRRRHRAQTPRPYALRYADDRPPNCRRTSGFRATRTPSSTWPR